MPIQNSAVVRKNRAKRSAVSGVIDRFPLTIALIRICGTPIALARAYWLRPKGFKKSSRSTSPGWVGGKSAMMDSSVIVNNFDIVGVTAAPSETNAPALVDPTAVLALSITH